MRKILFISAILLLLFVVVPALAQTFTFEEVGMSVTIPDKYIAITPLNAQDHAQLLLAKGYNAQEVPEIFASEGILLQAWNYSSDVCLEITALQDADAHEIYDIDQLTPGQRGLYRKEHLSGETYRLAGYKYSAAEWKKTAKSGRFLRLKYTRSEGKDFLYNGYSRKTVKNGYTIQLDMKVFDRKLKAADSKELDSIMNSVTYDKSLISAAGVIRRVTFDRYPPMETNTNAFTLSGKGEPGLVLVGTLARPGDGSAQTLTATINKKGEFTMPVKLPSEGVYVLTLTVLNGDEAVQNFDDFNTITYSASLLPVNITQPIPMEITADSVTLSGTSVKGAKIQLLYGNKKKNATVGAKKTFSFTIDTSSEGVYDFTLVITKSGSQQRRFQFQGTRVFTETEMRNKIRKEAIKPSYRQLTRKINAYDGRVMVYSPYVTDVRADGPDYLITLAMTRNNKGYSHFIVVTTSEEPGLTVGLAYKMYLRCIGLHNMSIEGGGETSYPHFELLFIQ